MNCRLVKNNEFDLRKGLNTQIDFVKLRTCLVFFFSLKYVLFHVEKLLKERIKRLFLYM